MAKKLFNPDWWVSFIPNGLGMVKPNHFGEMLKTLWDNRDQLPFAWRILNRGVCDGCALGTTGMRDFTMDGIHLCTVRLNLLRLNTSPMLDHRRLANAGELQAMSARELRQLGRLGYPMIRRRGEAGFTRISWTSAYQALAGRILATTPERLAFYLTSRGITNEVYYVAQKVARFLGTNNVDNSARICHAPSAVALKAALGATASTCSYKDWIGSDLIIFIGSNVPNNQPVTTKYLYYAKQEGTRIAVINTYREPGLEKYWVPSVMESAVFGTKLADDFYLIHTGGDIAFINGVLKALLEIDGLDRDFIANHTTGFAYLQQELERENWETLERLAGANREEMRRFARMYAQARSAVFVWSMGITQHVFGVDNVRALINLALARGMVGREKCGLMPIRGHSGVQGGAEMGCVPWTLPGGAAFDEKERFEQLWDFPLPRERGLATVDMIEAAHAGQIDLLYSVGGNFLETLPDPPFVHQALERVPLRVHQDIILSPQMFVEPAEMVLLLPACTRYEQVGGGTETTTERYVIFSPEIPGRRIGESKAEWEILMELAEAVYPQRRDQIHFPDAAAIREEISRAVPFYDGIQYLRQQGDAFQWGGQRLCENGNFATPDGQAHFSPVAPPEKSIPPGFLRLSTRRGKQFNSIVHQDRDPLTGAWREDIFMSAQDAAALGLQEGDRIRLRSETGEYQGTVKIAALIPGNLQVHWPEGNVLLKRGVREPLCGIPDYNALVEVLPLTAQEPARP